jgi:flagellar biosynthetic protein FliS
MVIQKYKIASEQVSGMDIIVELYAGSINLLKKAKFAYFQNKDLEGKYNYLNKVSKIFTALQDNLDDSVEGEELENLKKFYQGVIAKVFYLHNTEDEGEYDKLIGLITPVLNSWQEVASREQKPVENRQVEPTNVEQNYSSGLIISA